MRANPQRRAVFRPILGLACAVAALVAPPAAASQADYDRAYRLGLEAYKYGLPLVVMDRTYRHHTSVNVPDGRGKGPKNQFNHVRNLADADDRSVVAPNNDNLYSIAWIDLRKEPQVLRVPKVGGKRYFVFPMMTPYTENFANLGSVSRTKPGDYVITGPGQHRVKLPRGTKQIRSPYWRVWIIARPQVYSQQDVKRVRKLQNRYRLTPLSKYGTDWRRKPPKNRDTDAHEPSLPSGLAYFDRLGAELGKFPPPAADRPILERLAAVGIGPGVKTSKAELDPDTRRGLADAVADGEQSVETDVRNLYLSKFLGHNGWLVVPTGNYGTDYTFRAVVTQIGLGALPPQEAIYPFTVTDLTAQNLTGQKRYVVNLKINELPYRAFWSLTVYDNEGFFVPNPIDRYLVNDRSDLRLNEDGSADIYLQREKPSDPELAKNWLPTPAGEFRLILRLYGPPEDQIPSIMDGSGWKPPIVLPCPLPEASGLCPLV